MLIEIIEIIPYKFLKHPYIFHLYNIEYTSIIVLSRNI